MSKSSGWKGESARHALSAKGIKSGSRTTKYKPSHSVDWETASLDEERHQNEINEISDANESNYNEAKDYEHEGDSEGEYDISYAQLTTKEKVEVDRYIKMQDEAYRKNKHVVESYVYNNKENMFELHPKNDYEAGRKEALVTIYCNATHDFRFAQDKKDFINKLKASSNRVLVKEGTKISPEMQRGIDDTFKEMSKKLVLITVPKPNAYKKLQRLWKKNEVV